MVSNESSTQALKETCMESQLSMNLFDDPWGQLGPCVFFKFQKRNQTE